MNYPNAPFPIPKSILLQKLRGFLNEDIGFGDITSSMIPVQEQGSAKIKAKSSGILAGMEEAQLLFEDNDINVTSLAQDGNKVNKGDIIIELQGNLRTILMVERTALNFLMKLSSIASSTFDVIIQLKKENLTTKIAATRKTTPGFTYFEKKAVFLGGGDVHRWNLSDMILLKNTHLKYYQGDIAKLLTKTKEQTSFSKKIEIEIENPSYIPLAIQHGADIIMLDNMTPDQIRNILSDISLSKNIIFEASGNINIHNIVEYAKAGVDIISTSSLIFHPHKIMDFSLRLI
ncbi:carboxylating nicotinate-nucleotide diphosphorylase [Candidatus Harpocratesius sp.]